MRKLAITELPRLSVEEFKQTDKLSLVVVLDNVRSQHNVGAVFRTSDAYLIEAVYLCGITSVPPQPEIHKSALGAEFFGRLALFRTNVRSRFTPEIGRLHSVCH